MENRTVEDFVEDMVSNGKTEEQILAVTMTTRWSNSKGEVVKIYRKLMKRLKGKVR